MLSDGVSIKGIVMLTVAHRHPVFCLESLLSVEIFLLSISTEKRELNSSESGRCLRKRRTKETRSQQVRVPNTASFV